MELFLTGPAVRAELVLIKANGLNQAFDRLEAQGVKAHFFANALQHALSALGLGIGVFVQVLLTFIAFKFLNHATSNELHVGIAAREV